VILKKADTHTGTSKELGVPRPRGNDRSTRYKGRSPLFIA
jgi:hypothetical protein